MEADSNSKNSGADPKPPNSDDSGGTVYDEKFARLQQYLPFLNSTIARLESSKDKVRASQLAKMKNLQQILTSSTQRMKIDTLDRCEQVLKKLEEKLKFPIPTGNVDSSTSRIIKTEPEEVMESPASPPQPDLNPLKTTPKIIPVERCAAVERDFSKKEEETTSLEASRSRLKGLMLKSELMPSSSVPRAASPQIPGLDMMFPSSDSSVCNNSSQDSHRNLSGIEKQNQSQSEHQPILRDEWKRVESNSLSKPESGSNWSAEDVDDRRLGRVIDYRHSRRDIDDRHFSGSERQGMQIQSVMQHPPIYPLSVSHMAPSMPSLLPRHMPSHNMGFTPSASMSSSHEFHRSSENVPLEAAITKTYTGFSPQSNSPLLPTPLSGNSNSLLPLPTARFSGKSNSPLIPPPPAELFDRPNSHTRFASHSIEMHEGPSSASFFSSSKSFASSTSHGQERKSMTSVHSSPAVNTSKVETNKPTARERLMQRMDEVERLGVSSGGALRKLKSDIVEQKTVEAALRKSDPRLEREQRLSSLDEETQRFRGTAGFHDSAFNTSSIHRNVPNYSGQTGGFGNSLPGSAQWNQPHMNAPVGRTVFQAQRGVVNAYWQSTCTVKQTTAHDLGQRYQPRARQGKQTHPSHYERSMLSNASKPDDDRYPTSREPENHKKENELSHGLGRRLCDPRLSSKPMEEKKPTDSKTAESVSRRKENAIDNEESDFSSTDKKSKAGQGLHSYKIPKRPKEPSPPKEPNQSIKTLVDPRITTNRDPRLSKIVSRPLSPEPEKEMPVPEVMPSDSVPAQELNSKPVPEDPHLNAGDDSGDEATFRRETRTRSRTGSPEQSTQSPSRRSGSPETLSKSRRPSSSYSRGKSRGKSRSRSRSRSRAKSRGKSPHRAKANVKGSSRLRDASPRRSRGRSRSKSRAYSRGRSRSRSTARERSCSRSRGKSSRRSTSTCRGRSVSRSKSKYRARSNSSGRGKSKGRSPSTSRSRAKSRGRSPRTRAKSRGRSRERTSSRSRGRTSIDRSSSGCRSPHSRPKLSEKSRFKSSTRRSSSRSPSRSRRSPSHSRGRSVGRRQHTSRGRSQSSDSDNHLERWKRRESLSPDRRRHKSKSISRTRGRSNSSASNRSRNSSSTRTHTTSRSRRSRDHSRRRLDSRKRSGSRESFRAGKKTSSRSSSCSGRSSSLFSKGRSQSKSPLRESNFDKLLKKDCSAEEEFPTLSERVKVSASNTSASLNIEALKDSVVSSSLCESNVCSSGDVAADVPTSTSEIISEVSVKSVVGSTTEICGGSNNPKPEASSSSKPDGMGTSIDPGNIIVGLIKSLASQEIFKQFNYLELAAFAASQLPEDKRNKVLEIFREGSAETPPAEKVQDVEGLSKTKVEDSAKTDADLMDAKPDEKQGDDEAKMLIKDSKSGASSIAKKGKKKKQSPKMKIMQDGNAADSLNKSEVTPEISEKQKKKRGKNELEKLHEDIREMFISNDVVTATGQRSCRMRKENKEATQLLKTRPGTPDEKLKSLRTKSHYDNVMDSSDDSPLKSLNSTGSDYQPAESFSSKLESSSESDDGSPIGKWRRTSSDHRKRSKKNYLDSESESDSALPDLEVSKENSIFPKETQPMVVIEKSTSIPTARKNVARRGRKIGSMTRDQAKMREENYTPSYDGDCDEVEDEESQVEDKDMSQIDTSNIILVEGVGSKLTRNQLKLLKKPEQKCEVKLSTKRTLNISKEFSECESDASKTSESPSAKLDAAIFDSPVKKKRKVKKLLNCQSDEAKVSPGVQKEAMHSDLVGSSVDFSNQGSAVETGETNTSTDRSDTPIDVEMYELPPILGRQDDPQQEIKQEKLSSECFIIKPEYHKDLEYTSLMAERISCKVCSFSGKTIVGHYVNCHPSTEVFISRLSSNLAKQAIANTNRARALKKKRKPLKCLVCNYVANTSLRLYEHVTTHTGEYRFSCSLCGFKAAQRISMKSHRKAKHNECAVKDIVLITDVKECTSMNILFAYLCSECNYFQLCESNLKIHLQTYHADQPSAQAIRINLAVDVEVKSEVFCGEIGNKEDEEKTEVSKECSSVCQPAVPVDSLQECQSNMVNETETEYSANETFRKKIDEIIDNISDDAISTKLPDSDQSFSTRNPELLEDPPSAPTDKQSSSVDMSIFIGSEQLNEDENKLQEQRRKLLEDAGVKIRERPKARSAISEKLAQRFQSDHMESPAKVDVSCISAQIEEQSLHSSSSGDKSGVSGRTNLRTTPSRLAQKSSDSPEKPRLTRSISRTNVISDTESPVPSEVPDEVKAPLPASTLHSTLQRMQETIQSNVSPPPAKIASLAVTSSEISQQAQFKLKKGSVKVGLLEAKSLGDSQECFLFCLFPNCMFSTKQAHIFLKHMDLHSPKPVKAPCSVCDEGGNILRDLRSSFNHLVKYHLLEDSPEGSAAKSTYPPPASSLMSSPKAFLIRPRKLPGDILSHLDASSASLPDSEESGLPSLVISSVVSLSKDHTPDGTPLETQSTSMKAHDKITSAKFVTQFLKDQNSMMQMMRVEKICHLFKCMGRHCSFSTNMKGTFAEHYQKHQLKELQRSFTESETYAWQKCVYCGESKNSGEELVDHILVRHAVQKYQCSGCFYRAACITSVLFHQQKSHSSNVMVIECLVLQFSLRTEHSKTLSQTSKIQIYKCCQGSEYGECGMLFVSSEDFSAHQQLKHAQDNILYCNECGLGLDSSPKLICHYSTSHSYRKYHCLHCPKASETRDEISMHMCLDHPDQNMIVASRTYTRDPNCVETIGLQNGHRIGALNLKDILPVDPSSLTPSVELETDSNVDPSFFDKEPTLSSHTFDIGAASAWMSTYGSYFPNYLHQSGRNSAEGSGNYSEHVVRAGADGPETSLDEDTPKDNNACNLSGSSLYLCGYAGCSFKAETSPGLKAHLVACELAHDGGSLSCVHCKKVFRNPSTLIEHLPKHGVPRYVCGLCNDFRTTHPTMAIRHMRHKHKITAVEMVPENDSQNELDTDLLIIRPKENVPKRGKGKALLLNSNKTVFGPEDRHDLPLSAVFTRDVTCSVCNYTTKVRSNMIRHLEQHASGCEPSSVPVLNPVPCLERNEKMFDTMTNHAISSTIPVRRDSNAFKVTDEPRFVPENQRYVCCAPACLQISSSDAMLRHHIRVLHPEILIYKCPHCPEYENDTSKQPLMMEKLGSHLKMHDSRLYSCLSCSYYHYHRHIVERHTAEKHPEQKLIRIVREPQPDGPVDTENVIDTESEIMGSEGAYECGLCSMKGNKAEITSHVASVHRIHAQYKCTVCNFRSNARARFTSHFLKQHPEEKEDFIEVYRKCKIEKPSDDAAQPIPELSTPPIEPLQFDSTPLWRRDSPRVRHLRGILFEENGLKPKQLEHGDLGKLEVPSTVRYKRQLSSSSNDDPQNNKRRRKDDACFTCAKCFKKFAMEQEKDYRVHLRSHFYKDDDRFQCKRCFRSFSSSDETVIHALDAHQEVISAADVVDTHSEDFTNMDVTRQMLGMQSPNDATVSASSPILPSSLSSPQNNQNKTPSPNHRFSPKKTTNSTFGNLSGFKRRLSPRPSPDLRPSTTPPASSSLAASPSKKLDTVQNVCPEPKGIKALETIQSLPVSIKSTKESEAQMNLSAVGSKEPQCQTETCLVNVDDDIDVDESALEGDIEEVEDEDDRIEESTSKHIRMDGEQNSSLSEKTTLRLECRYKDLCGCTIISKTKQEAAYHEMKHWEIKPWKCGHCSYQAVRDSYIRVHSAKKHPGIDINIIKNDLPEFPKILPVTRQNNKSGLTARVVSSQNTSASVEESSDVNIDELADVEELFKDVHILRCGYCRLRETSLNRLLFHWKSSHKNNKTYSEEVSYGDGRRAVPFKFRKVNLGIHEKAKMAFKCGLCAKSGTIKLLLEHYPSRHPGEKLKISELIHDRAQCSECPRQFSAKASLTNHFLSEHPGVQISSFKINTKESSNDLESSMGCFYCLEPVKTALEMKEHHLQFHSHLDAKYIELENIESVQQPPTNLEPDEKPSTNIGLLQQPSTKRAVARKSTSRIHSVARKSTGGRTWHMARLSPSNQPCSDTHSDSDDESLSSCEEMLDEIKISCPMIIEGTVMRVSLATLSKYSNIYPTVVLERLTP